MTISTTATRTSYNGNGITTAFSFPYYFLANGDLVVVSVASDGTETTQVLNTDYTVTGAGAPAGGTVNMIVAPTSNEKLVIYRDVAITQEVDYITGDAFPAETHEAALDRLTMIAQQLDTGLERSLSLPISVDGVSVELPIPEAGKHLAWNISATGLINDYSPQELADPQINVVDSISSLLNETGIRPVFVKNYHSDVEGGGGVFYWDATKDKSLHNGGTVIDPNIAFPTDWTNQTQLTTWFTAGTGTGCWVRQYDGEIKDKHFGSKNDNTTDDYLSIKSALELAISNKEPLHISAGQTVIGSSFDFDTLPSGDVTIIGEEGISYKGTGTSSLIGAPGLSVMFNQSFDATLATQRKFKIKNFSIKSKDPFDDLTTRAALEAFNLYCCPNSEFENIDFLGITSGFHVRASWLSKFKNISTSRVDKGIFVDGDDGSGGYGWADFVKLDNISVGSYAKSDGWGLRLRGSKSSKIDMIDMESGYQASGLILEGTKGVEVNGIYTESYDTTQPISVKPIDGSALTDLEDYNINTSLRNIHSLSTGQSSGSIAVVAILKGSKNITLEKARHFRGDGTGRESEVGPLIQFSGSGLTNPNGALYISHINLIDCALSDRDTVLTNSDPYSQMFRINGNIVQKSSNRTYYGLVLDERDVYVNTALSTNQFVLTKGTLAQALTITASTTTGSRMITVDNTTNLVVGTYVDVGAQSGLLVTSIDGLNVWLGEEIDATATGVAVSYTAPTYL